MSKTTKKIEKIIEEIEESNSSSKNISEKKSVSQVVNILLDKKREKGIIDNGNKDFDRSQFYFDMDELLYWKEKNNEYYRVEYYRSILTHRRFTGKAIIFLKKVIRKMVRFLVEPIVKDQNEFNASVTASFNALCNNEIITQSFIEEQKSQLALINERISQLSDIKSNTMESLQPIIEEQNREIDRLKDKLEEFSEYQEKDLFNEMKDEANALKCKNDNTEY